jgi:Mn2+/Fe2+ NRAMP family transporter
MFLAQVVNALLLPFILVFVMALARDRKLMGPLASGRRLQAVGIVSTVVLIGMSVILVITALSG